MLTTRFIRGLATKAIPGTQVATNNEDIDLHGSLVMGKVSSDRYKKVVKCGVPKHRFNEILLMYIRESYNVQALDENDICRPGDWVLLRRKRDIVDRAVTHEVERIVYTAGNFIDPITNKRSFGYYFDEEIKKLEKIKVDI